jgi:hypothetical protein
MRVGIVEPPRFDCRRGNFKRHYLQFLLQDEGTDVKFHFAQRSIRQGTLLSIYRQPVYKSCFASSGKANHNHVQHRQRVLFLSPQSRASNPHYNNFDRSTRSDQRGMESDFLSDDVVENGKGIIVMG